MLLPLLKFTYIAAQKTRFGWGEVGQGWDGVMCQGAACTGLLQGCPEVGSAPCEAQEGWCLKEASERALTWNWGHPAAL